ncbi:hypothetical protein BAE36_10980 [Rhizobium leguminosarum bv. trifolii]|nr:hypothetical protein BAE36_10980 [Rhizobium leguminosarum bv. trifolii]
MERPAFAGRFSFVDTGDKIPDRHQDFGREFLIGRNPGKADGGMSPLGRRAKPTKSPRQRSIWHRMMRPMSPASRSLSTTA